MRRVFIISDLHLGGRPDERCVQEMDGQQKEVLRPGLQICYAYAELHGFVTWLMSENVAGQGRPDELELVINGDIVDFLAEDDEQAEAQTFLADEDLAIERLQVIIERTRVVEVVNQEGQTVRRGVFDALRSFLEAGHRLTLLLGNHDVELALPAVRAFLVDLLGGPREHLRLVLDGEAYSVGRLLIEHGNRYDSWNQIDHDQLRQDRSLRSRRVPVVYERSNSTTFFVAPPGTHLVIHFLNAIKQRYRFLDLLKPETELLVPLLLALEPSVRPRLDELLRFLFLRWQERRRGMRSSVLTRRQGDMGSQARGDLVTTSSLEDEVGECSALDSLLQEVLGAQAGEFADTDTDTDTAIQSGDLGAGDMGARDSLRSAWSWLVAKWRSLQDKQDCLVMLARIRNAKIPEQRMRRLLLALRKLDWSEEAFDSTREVERYLDAARFLAAGNGESRFDVVAFGHTHLPKDVPLREGQEWPRYLNSGTWADVMRLPEALQRTTCEGSTGPEVNLSDLEDVNVKKALEDFLEEVRTNDFDRYRRRYLSYLVVEVDLDERRGFVSSARLCSYCGAGREDEAPLADFFPREAGQACP